MADPLLPPDILNNDNLEIDRAQAPIRDAEPAARPPHAALPLAGDPEQHAHDEAGDQRDLLEDVDEPVGAAADDAAAVLARAQELPVEEVRDPQREHHQHEGVLAPPRPQRQVLRPQRRLQDQQVEVDLWW